jgi:hypothetical protein
VTTKRALTVNVGDVVQIDGNTVTVERLEANVAIVWTGSRFPGGPIGEQSYGCGGDHPIEIISEVESA